MKKILFVLFVFSLVFAGCKKEGCTEPTALNYDSEANQEDGSCEFAPIVIGSSYQGGIVFYLDGLGGGLTAAPTDQSVSAGWGCYEFLGADGTAIGTGNQNTIDIEAGCPIAGTAADICANLVLSGYTDWFLPSRDELTLMYQNIGPGNDLGLGNVGGFEASIYWSSTELNLTSALWKNFGDGGEGSIGKNSGYCVRAVRAF
jgi:hypothetical protein